MFWWRKNKNKNKKAPVPAEPTNDPGSLPALGNAVDWSVWPGDPAPAPDPNQERNNCLARPELPGSVPYRCSLFKDHTTRVHQAHGMDEVLAVWDDQRYADTNGRWIMPKEVDR